MKKRRELTKEEQQWAANLKRLWLSRGRSPKTGRKLSQEEAAERAGWVAQSTVSQYINGVIPLNTDAILKFADLIPCRPHEINPKLGKVSGENPSNVYSVREAPGEGESEGKYAITPNTSPEEEELLQTLRAASPEEREYLMQIFRIAAQRGKTG